MIIKNHIGVYALILNANKDALLLIRKGMGPYKGTLDLPGGSLEDGETLDQVLMREVMEETGCTVKSYRQLSAERLFFDTTDPKTGNSVRWQHIGILYSATTDDEPALEIEGIDSMGTVWVPLADFTNSNASPMALKAYEIHISTAKSDDPSHNPSKK